MITYLYSEDVRGLTMETVMGHLYCAEKYGIERLVKKCHAFVQDNLDATNYCLLLEQTKGIRLHEEKIHHLAMKVASHQVVTVFCSPNFLQLSEESVLKLLRRDARCNYAETMHWTWLKKVECQMTLQDGFSGIIETIRFPVMSESDLANGPIKDLVLTPDDVYDLFQHKHATIKPAIRFSNLPRQPHSSQTTAVIRMLVYTREVATNQTINLLAGHLTLQVMPEMAPACSHVLFQLTDNDENCDVSYGRCGFTGTGEAAQINRQCPPIPRENDELSCGPYWVSMVRGEDEEGSVVVKSLCIGHPTVKAANQENGTVFGRIVSGFDALKGLDSVLSPLQDESLGHTFVHTGVRFLSWAWISLVPADDDG